MTPLTLHFDLEEFLRSDMAARMGRRIEAGPVIEMQLRRLTSILLEPVRIRVGRAVRVLSGYRPQWLNSLVGGSKTSEHMEGRAADIEVEGLTPMQLAQLIVDLGLPFHQLILEFGQWVHISVPDVNELPARQVLTAMRVNGKTVYLPGLHEKAAA
jgi:zinc D-Ala-D-Ala carboxypeptidase